MTLPQSSKKPIVLVADGEKVIADTLTIILNQSGFAATAVYSGEEAVERARTLRPDVLICKIIMSDMNGVDASIIIRGFLPDCRVLLISTSTGMHVGVEARERGYDFELVEIPIPPEELLSKLEDVRLRFDSGLT
jgi:CheY-like chemotaxis protein